MKTLIALTIIAMLSLTITDIALAKGKQKKAPCLTTQTSQYQTIERHRRK